MGPNFEADRTKLGERLGSTMLSTHPRIESSVSIGWEGARTGLRRCHFGGSRIGLGKEAQAGRDGARNKDERVPSGSGGNRVWA